MFITDLFKSKLNLFEKNVESFIKLTYLELGWRLIFVSAHRPFIYFDEICASHRHLITYVYVYI